MPDLSSVAFKYCSPGEALSLCAQAVSENKRTKVSLNYFSRSARGINLCFDSCTVVDIYLPKETVRVDNQQLSLAL